MKQESPPTPLESFLAAACTFDPAGTTEESEQIFRTHPELATDVAVAAVRGDTSSLVAGLVAGAAGLSKAFGGSDAPTPSDSIPPALRTYGPGGRTLLLLNCFSNYGRPGHERHDEVVSAAQILLQGGADPNAVAQLDPFDARRVVSPLFGAAAILGSEALTTLLLENGAHPLAGEALARVAERQHLDCFSRILERGNIDATDESEGVEEETALHAVVDRVYSDDALRFLLSRGADPEKRSEPGFETALHIAARRRRTDAIRILADHGAELNAQTAGGKTAYAHAIRRGFDEIADELRDHGCNLGLAPADELAVALVKGDLPAAKKMLEAQPELVASMGPEENRILPDLTGRAQLEPVRFLLENGINLDGRGLDDGTALHQAAWFGQPEQVKLLLSFEHPVDPVDRVHRYTPLGWCAHGSSFSGDAESRQEDYVRIARLLLEAGATLARPFAAEHDPDGSWLLRDASPAVETVLREFGAKA